MPTSCNAATINGPCRLLPGHKGYHSVVVFYCDGCDRPTRGDPYRKAYNHEGEVEAVFCFPCVTWGKYAD